MLYFEDLRDKQQTVKLNVSHGMCDISSILAHHNGDQTARRPLNCFQFLIVDFRGFGKTDGIMDVFSGFPYTAVDIFRL